MLLINFISIIYQCQFFKINAQQMLRELPFIEECLNICGRKRLKLNPKYQIRQVANFNQIHSTSLQYLAALCQTEEGIYQLSNLQIEDGLNKLLADKHINTIEQDNASLILCNLYVVARPTPPSLQLTASIINLVEKGSFQTASNCLALIFNIANDHFQWKKGVATIQFCESICRHLKDKACNDAQKINVVRTIMKLAQGPNAKEGFLLFITPIIRIIKELDQREKEISGYAFFCLYFIYLLFPKDTQSAINSHHIFTKIVLIATELSQIHVTTIMLQMIMSMISVLTQQQLKRSVFAFLQHAFSTFCQRSLELIETIYSTIIIILEGNLVAQLEFPSQSFCEGLLTQLLLETDAQRLRILVHILAKLITKQHNSLKAQVVLEVFEKVKIRLSQNCNFMEFMRQIELNLFK